MGITENHSLGFKMKSSPLSPEWRKKRQEMTEKLIRKGMRNEDLSSSKDCFTILFISML